MSLKKISTRLLALLYSSLVMAQSPGSSQIVISGTVSGDLNGYNKLYIFIGHDDKDSTTIQEGHFSYSCPFKDPTYIMVLPQAVLKSAGGYFMNPVVTDQPGTYTINLQISSTDMNNRKYVSMKVEASGTKATSIYESFKQQQNEIYKKRAASKPMAAIQPVQSTKTAPASDSNGKTARMTPAIRGAGSTMDAQNDSTHQHLISLVQDFVGAHPDSYASIFILQTIGLSTLNMEQQEKSYNLLSKKIKGTQDGKRFYDHIKGSKNGRVGNSVTAFTLDDPNGNKIDLASFKGKYVLIDFWASWCGPCRRSFPYMRKLYSAYKSPSFEMYSISIDKKKNDWLKAVKEENNPWPQSLDTIDISAAGFGIAGVPTAVLLDPEGKIVARETGIETDGTDGIEKKLIELFGKKM